MHYFIINVFLHAMNHTGNIIKSDDAFQECEQYMFQNMSSILIFKLYYTSKIQTFMDNAICFPSYFNGIKTFYYL